MKKIKLNIVSIPIDCPVPITKEFRKSINKFIKTWFKNKNSKKLRLGKKFQEDFIKLSNEFKFLKFLSDVWVCDTSQDLQAFHSLANPKPDKKQLKEMLKNIDESKLKQI